MATPLQKRKSGVLPVIWTITDERWLILEPVLLEDAPPRATGRPRSDGRTILNGILFRLRSGCPWNKRPSEFGEDSTVHRWFLRSGFKTRTVTRSVIESIGISRVESLLLTLLVRFETGRRLRNTIVLSMKHR